MLKSDLLNRQIRAGSVELLPGGCLEVFPMPVGAMCTITMKNGVIVTKNGRTTFQGDQFGQLLWDSGVRGNFVIVHKKKIVSVAKWFTFSQHDGHYGKWCSEIEIHNYNGVDGIIDGVEFTSISGIILSVDQIYSASTEYSKNINFDGFMIPVKSNLGEVRYYHALPNRYIDGTILNVIHWGTTYSAIIAKIDTPTGPHVIRINRICMRIKEQINALYSNGCHNIINKTMRLSYCTYRPGDHFNNYTSTVAIRILD